MRFSIVGNRRRSGGFSDTLFAAAKFSVVSKYLVYAVQVVSLVVLARTFTPYESGLIAGCLVFYNLLFMLSEAGIQSAIINSDINCRKQQSTLYIAPMVFGAILASLMVIFADQIVLILDHSTNVTVVHYMAMALFFNTSSIYCGCALAKDRKFVAPALISSVAELASLCGVLFLNSRQVQTGAPALALKYVLYSSINTIALHLYVNFFHRKLGRLGFDLKTFSQIYKEAKFVLGFNVLVYTSRNVDNFFVGALIGPSALGHYQKAYQLMRYPLMLISFALAPAIQSSIRSGNYEKSEIADALKSFMSTVFLISSVATLLIILFATPAIDFALGPQWGQVAHLLKIFALSIPAQTISALLGPVFLAMEAQRKLFKLGIIGAIITVSATLYGVSFGSVQALASYISLAYVLNSVITFFVVKRVLGRSLTSRAIQLFNYIYLFILLAIKAFDIQL